MFSSFSRGGASASGDSSGFSPDVNEVDLDEVLCAVEFGKPDSGRNVGAGVSVVGVCLFDRRAFKFQFCEFSTTSDLAVLEGLLLQVRPSCVISTEAGGAGGIGEGWRKKLADLVAACECEFVPVKKNSADTASLHQDLAALLVAEDSIKNHVSRELQLKTATAACAALLSYARLLSDDMYIRQCTLETYPIGNYLRIDNAAAAALYLFPSCLQQSQQQALLPLSAKSSGASRASSLACALSAGGGISSVYALMSRWCSTQLGARRLFTCMSQPLVDREKIEERYDIVELFQTDEAFRRQVFCNHFKHVFDLDRLAGRFHRLASAAKDLDADEALRGKKGSIFSRVKLTLEDLVKLYDCAVECASLETTLRGYAGIHRGALEKAFTEPLSEAVKSFSTFINLVEFTIDMEEAKQGSFVISRRFDSELASLLDKKEDLRTRMNRERQRAEEDIPFASRKRDAEIVKLMEDNTMGFVLRVTKKDQPAVLSSRGRYHQVRLNKSELIFTTSELRGLCREFKDVSEAYAIMQNSLVEKALLVAASYWPAVEKLAELLGMLDVLGAFAAAANAAPTPYVRPQIVEGDAAGLVLKASRHPLLEIQPGSSSFIANDVHLDRERRLAIITGPNMGGKSTYIRQVALTVLLAQIGSFVPCASCQLPIFTQVICRVGASDIQLRGVSTFLAEMVEAAAILRNADTRSLVVIDELGRGTSTYEGFGLAWAIARHLAAEAKCFSLFATHFHEMGQLSEEVPGVSNLHVSAAVNRDTQQLTFLYRLQPGCVDQSFGVHVAGFAGLPAAVVERARQKSAELEAVERGEQERRENARCGARKRSRSPEPDSGGEAPQREGERGEAKADERGEREGGGREQAREQWRERRRAFGRLTRCLKELFEVGDAGGFVRKVTDAREKLRQLKEAAAPPTWKEVEGGRCRGPSAPVAA
ncbi:UNVERIFIED_CONTAM: MutS domain V domain-containing protein [Hammondia hammondi]|eukprot:XP_008882967.1 MutS domain V domain-containing protein [Hammondia hammondi]